MNAFNSNMKRRRFNFSFSQTQTQTHIKKYYYNRYNIFYRTYHVHHIQTNIGFTLLFVSSLPLHLFLRRVYSHHRRSRHPRQVQLHTFSSSGAIDAPKSSLLRLMYDDMELATLFMNPVSSISCSSTVFGSTTPVKIACFIPL